MKKEPTTKELALKATKNIALLIAWIAAATAGTMAVMNSEWEKASFAVGVMIVLAIIGTEHRFDVDINIRENK